MGATLTTAANILKEFYLGPVREELNNSTILLSRLQRDTESFVGKEAYIPMHTSRNSGIGARGEGGTLPTAGNQTYDKCLLTAAYLYGRLQVTGPMLEAMRTSKGSFLRALESEMKALKMGLKRDASRQCYNDANGSIATCGTTSASTTVQLATDANMNNFFINQLVDIVAASSGTAVSNGTGVKITAIDKSSKTITINGSGVTTTSSNIVVMASSYGKEMKGLEAWLASDDNTIGNINRSTAGNEYFKPNILDNSGTARALSLDLMQQAFDQGDISLGATPTLILCDHTQRRKYLALVRADRRHVDTQTLDGGFKALDYNGVPLVADNQCPAGRMYFVDESSGHLYVLSDWGWMDQDGATLSRVANTDAYEATMRAYMNPGFELPAANTTLTDLAS